MLAEVGRPGARVVVVTAPPTRGSFGIRAQGALRRFEGAAVDERVQLELPSAARRRRAPSSTRSPWSSFRAGRSTASTSGRGSVGMASTSSCASTSGAWSARAEASAASPTGSAAAGPVDRARALGRAARGPGRDRARRRPPRSRATSASDFQASGLYHLLAVSGQNVVLVAGGALALAWLLGVRALDRRARRARRDRRLRARGRPAAVGDPGRDRGLARVARLADAAGCATPGTSCSSARSPCSRWNPYLVYDPGFQLSFAAVAAIFTLAPRIARRLEGYPLPGGSPARSSPSRPRAGS